VGTALRPALGERNSGLHAEGRVCSEPRLTVPKIYLGFIADSLFSLMLLGSCRTRGRSLDPGDKVRGLEYSAGRTHLQPFGGGLPRCRPVLRLDHRPLRASGRNCLALGRQHRIVCDVRDDAHVCRDGCRPLRGRRRQGGLPARLGLGYNRHRGQGPAAQGTSSRNPRRHAGDWRDSRPGFGRHTLADRRRFPFVRGTHCNCDRR
jgi:hypothetical protein